MRFFHLSFEKGGAKELEWGLVEGACVVVIPASIGVWDVCEGRDITDGGFVKMRGRNTRTVPPACFFFIVKSDIKIFVCSVAESTIFIRIRGRLIASPTNVKMNNE